MYISFSVYIDFTSGANIYSFITPLGYALPFFLLFRNLLFRNFKQNFFPNVGRLNSYISFSVYLYDKRKELSEINTYHQSDLGCLSVNKVYAIGRMNDNSSQNFSPWFLTPK